jgi:hypothetical protein
MARQAPHSRRLRYIARSLTAAGLPAAAAAPAGVQEQLCPVATSPGSEATAEDKLAFFRSNGYLLLDDVLEGRLLADVQRDFERVVQPLRAKWASGVRDNELGIQSGAVYARNALETSEALLSLVDRPAVTELMTEIVGADLSIRQIQVQSVLPQPTADLGGYVGWHRDKANYNVRSNVPWAHSIFLLTEMAATSPIMYTLRSTQPSQSGSSASSIFTT